MNELEKIALELAKGEMSKDELAFKIAQIDSLVLPEDENFESLHLMGLPILNLDEDLLTLSTKISPYEKQRYCIVDLETSASNIESGQIIEIGAVMIEDGEEVAKFDSLVHAKAIPEVIQNLTGITPSLVEDAPSVGSVLEQFRLFLGEAVFVAHNVKFDYGFLSDSMQKQGFGPLLNRKLCTINLARKTIKAQKYGLDFLREFLNINEVGRHRALADAQSAMIIFKKALENVPPVIKTTEDLINFTTSKLKL
ncbi:MAG: 3'-5' exonuclease [Campylobacteraceae bacterium]|jgi:DNA polymerase-3 subunit epsilon|nr:3'-5' exonuclease [Campylobacteraceae bacterium]